MATVQKRNNSYKITASCGYDINGKQIRKSTTWTPSPGMTQRQIEKELERQKVIFEDKCSSGQYLDGKIKFADFSEYWFKEYAEKQLRPKTIARYKELIKRINAVIGHIQLEKLQPTHLIRFYDSLQNEGVRADTKYKSRTSIDVIIKQHGYTLERFANAASVGITTLRTALKGNAVSRQTALKIADALNMSIDVIFSADENGKKNLSGKTILHHHRLISSILTTAVQWQVIIANPCDRVKPPKSEKIKPRYLDDKQAADVLSYLQNEPVQFKTIITLLMYTGMRRGELCGLKWSDIDMKNKLINIQRSVLYIPEKGIFEDETKNETSKRVIKVSDEAIKELKAYKSYQCEERLKVGDKWINGNYVFTTWDGKPLRPDTLTNDFRKFVKKYNLPDVCLHSLRHTNATLLIASGVNLTTVADRLGHANTATTAKIYAHAIKTADEMAAETLQDILKPKLSKAQ